MKLIIDNREGNRNTDKEYIDVKHDLAVSLLSLLDGGSHTLITLEREDGYVVNIGGGPGQYVFTMTSNTEDNYTLINQSETELHTIELCAGGQFADFSGNLVVDFSTANEALGNFFSRTEMKLAWERSL